jgi:hypothetical chaperone protein
VFVGMDFGTTNSGMSVYDGEHLRLIPLDPANRNPHVARTALYITNDRYVHIGRNATDTYYEQNLNRPSKIERVRVGEIEQTFAELPTFIRDVFIDKDIYSPGRLFLSFKMGLSSPNYLGTIVGNQYFFLEDIIATYLYTTKKRAEAYLDTELDTIVLGRPVRYSDDLEHNEFAKERMIQSAFRAGYKTVYLQYEPIAAAYYYETTINTEQNVLIFDFGGGTLDMSIVHLGNPKTRRVIANGGIPIAGDVFDQHIVRAKYPKHFGEGSTFISGNTELAVPSAFYEAFADWQTLLTLQLADSMETLRRIENTSKQAFKIKGLRQLITGQYGLKMFDIAEQAKRDLSDRLAARLDMEGDGFRVFDSITRSEFERLIRPDARDITERLDTVLRDANMTPADIDAVIRTGGSSQIPLFVNLLEERFGAEKVHDIDAFSSVTSGLGVIGYRIQQGEIDLPSYSVDAYTGTTDLHSDAKTRVPRINLEVLKRVIDIQENRGKGTASTVTFIARDANLKLYAAYCDDMQPLPANHFGELDETTFVYALPADSQIVLLTTDYMSYRKAAGEVADLRASDLTVEAMDGYRRDTFSNEYVYNIAAWDSLKNADFVISISTLGYTQKFIGERILEKMAQPVPYKFEKLRGYPAFLVGAMANQDYVVITHSGRAARIPAEKLSVRETRLINVPLKGNMIGAFAASSHDEILIATGSSYARRITVDSIPYVTETNTNGAKVMQRSNPVIAMPYEPNKPLWALTNKRILPVDAAAIPLDNTDTSEYILFKTKKGEKLITLFTLPY